MTRNLAFLSSFASLAAAIAAKPGCLELDCACPVSANVTIPSGVTLRYAGGMLQPAQGVTMQVLGPIMAPPVQIFGGAGSCLVGSQFLAEAWVEWWGAIADYSYATGAGTDAAPAINRALLSLPPNNPATGGSVALRFAGDRYALASSINLVNNPANNNRSSQVLLGKYGGRRGNGADGREGTELIWTGNATDPMIRLHSRNCHIRGFIFRPAPGLWVNAAIEIDNPGGLSEIVTANRIRDCFFAGGIAWPGGMNYGVEIGPTVTAQNLEYMLLEGCGFDALHKAAIHIPNGTGQSKFNLVRDCAFNDCVQFVIVNCASVCFDYSNFSHVLTVNGVTLPAISIASSFEPITFTICDNEGCPLMFNVGAFTVNSIGCRWSLDGMAQTAPPSGQEYMVGFETLNSFGDSFQQPAIMPNTPGQIVVAWGFIRPANQGGFANFIGTSFNGAEGGWMATTPNPNGMPPGYQDFYVGCVDVRDGPHCQGAFYNRRFQLNQLWIVQPGTPISGDPKNYLQLYYQTDPTQPNQTVFACLNGGPQQPLALETAQ